LQQSISDGCGGGGGSSISSSSTTSLILLVGCFGVPLRTGATFGKLKQIFG
jgi:hypothetical protein